MTALATIMVFGQTTVTFSSISSAFRDLRLVAVGNTNAGVGSPGLQFNNDTTYGNYQNLTLRGDGSSATSRASTNAGIYPDLGGGDLWNSTTVGTCTWDILDYSATNKQKAVLSRLNSPSSNVTANAHRWSSTAAISTITVRLASGAGFGNYSTFTLYGIPA